MTQGEARIGAGNVPIRLLNAEGVPEDLVLYPNYNAAMTISNVYGGISQAIEKVDRLDLDTIAHVVQLGLGYGTQTRRGPVDLPRRVYMTGVNNGLADQCITYLQVLAAGGRPPPDNVPDEPPDPRNVASHSPSGATSWLRRLLASVGL